MQKILTVKNLVKIYGTKTQKTIAIDNISFDMESGEFLAIMGASGSGKTTLLNCISTIDKASSGHIEIAGDEISKKRAKALEKFRREKLGFIFQDYNLIDSLNVFENIALPLSINSVKSSLIPDIVKEIAKKLAIDKKLNNFPYELSGGEKQRVASARAIVHQPSLILADEPTGALDSKSSRDLLNAISELNQKEKASIIMVTHDNMAASYSSRVLFLKDGKIFNELIRASKSRKEFFDDIMNVLSLLGGDLNA